MAINYWNWAELYDFYLATNFKKESEKYERPKTRSRRNIGKSFIQIWFQPLLCIGQMHQRISRVTVLHTHLIWHIYSRTKIEAKLQHWYYIDIPETQNNLNLTLQLKLKHLLDNSWICRRKMGILNSSLDLRFCES